MPYSRPYASPSAIKLAMLHSRVDQPRRAEEAIHPFHQEVDQGSQPNTSKQIDMLLSEMSGARQQRILHDLLVVPASPKRADAAKVRRTARWKLAVVRWIGLILLVLVVGSALFQPSLLHTGQQALFTFGNRLAGVFILPTPTPLPPTPTPVPRLPPGSAEVVSIIQSVFGSYSDQAIAVARCESSLNPSAINPTPVGNSHAEGLFQILYPSTWRTTSQASQSPYDANANTLAAYEIFRRDGYSWREWVCQP